MKTVITYGTFDLFHVGHVQILERARALGDRLIVGVSSDEFNAIKGKKSIFPYEHRARIVSTLRCVDGVFPEHDWGQKERDIRYHNADIFVMGHDWEGKFDNLKDFCEVIYLPRTDGISTTELKSAIKSFQKEKIIELKNGLDTLSSLVMQLN
mgnify:CR=1 FL=1